MIVARDDGDSCGNKEEQSDEELKQSDKGLWNEEQRKTVGKSAKIAQSSQPVPNDSQLVISSEFSGRTLDAQRSTDDSRQSTGYRVSACGQVQKQQIRSVFDFYYK